MLLCVAGYSDFIAVDSCSSGASRIFFIGSQRVVSGMVHVLPGEQLCDHRPEIPGKAAQVFSWMGSHLLSVGQQHAGCLLSSIVSFTGCASTTGIQTYSIGFSMLPEAG